MQSLILYISIGEWHFFFMCFFFINFFLLFFNVGGANKRNHVELGMASRFKVRGHLKENAMNVVRDGSPTQCAHDAAGAAVALPTNSASSYEKSDRCAPFCALMPGARRSSLGQWHFYNSTNSRISSRKISRSIEKQGQRYWNYNRTFSYYYRNHRIQPSILNVTLFILSCLSLGSTNEPVTFPCRPKPAD